MIFPQSPLLTTASKLVFYCVFFRIQHLHSILPDLGLTHPAYLFNYSLCKVWLKASLMITDTLTSWNSADAQAYCLPGSANVALFIREKEQTSDLVVFHTLVSYGELDLSL